MSWNLLTLLVPATSLVGAIAAQMPSTFQESEQWEVSPHDRVVRDVAHRILDEIMNDSESPYYDSLCESLRGLPKSGPPKTLQTFLETRLRVVSLPALFSPRINALLPMQTFGTKIDTKQIIGRFYLATSSTCPKSEGAVRWLAARECYHILNDTHLMTHMSMAIASFAAAFFSTFIMGWTLLPSLGVTWLTTSITGNVSHYSEEKQADAFANQYCTPEEKRQGIVFLEYQSQFPPRGVHSFLNGLVNRLYGFSEVGRAAAIRGSLVWAQRAGENLAHT